MAVSMGFTICLTSIAIGSEVAYGIFVSLNASGLLTSYIICIACVFWLCFALNSDKLTHKSQVSSKSDFAATGSQFLDSALAKLATQSTS